MRGLGVAIVLLAIFGVVAFVSACAGVVLFTDRLAASFFSAGLALGIAMFVSWMADDE